MTQLLTALGFLFSIAGQAATTDALVGWRFMIERDAGRQYSPAAGDGQGAGARPVAITLWYPAAARAGRLSAVTEFARLGAYQALITPPPAAFDEAVAQAVRDTSDSAMSTLTRSYRDAAPMTGKYPLIIFAHSTPLGQVSMAESLAARGFVVAGLMSRGATAGAYRLSVDDVRSMADDMVFARGRLKVLPFVDADRVGIIGMSNGALGAIGAANRIEVKGVVSLDGTVGERAATRVLPESYPTRRSRPAYPPCSTSTPRLTIFLIRPTYEAATASALRSSFQR